MITPERTSLSPVLAQQIQALAYCGHDRLPVGVKKEGYRAGQIIYERVLPSFSEKCAECRDRRHTLHAVASLAQAEQREQDGPFMQHKGGCRSEFCYVCVGRDLRADNYVHRQTDNAFYHRFKPCGCTCGLAAIRSADPETSK